MFSRLACALFALIFFSYSSAIASPEVVIKFAPKLRFDRAAVGYPMSAQPFFEAVQRASNGAPFERHENTDKASLQNGSVPTYYQIRAYGQQVRIHYWWFYGYQHPCFADMGSHNGDWEHVMVTLAEDQSRVAAVTYYQHNGSYTRIAGPRDAPCTPAGTGRCQGSRGFPSEGTHPIVYVGKLAHGSYHDSNSVGPAGAGGCAYYGDFRNPASSADELASWTNLINLDSDAESWIAFDRNGNFSWGPDGISTHPTQKAPQAAVAMCEGSPTYALASAGCYQSECLAGDDQASEDCIKECKPGYTNIGLICSKRKFPWTPYGRLTGGNKYNYNFTIPLHDAGLIRRRSGSNEWSLPQ